MSCTPAMCMQLLPSHAHEVSARWMLYTIYVTLVPTPLPIHPFTLPCHALE